MIFCSHIKLFYFCKFCVYYVHVGVCDLKVRSWEDNEIFVFMWKVKWIVGNLLFFASTKKVRLTLVFDSDWDNDWEESGILFAVCFSKSTWVLGEWMFHCFCIHWHYQSICCISIIIIVIAKFSSWCFIRVYGNLNVILMCWCVPSYSCSCSCSLCPFSLTILDTYEN